MKTLRSIVMSTAVLATAVPAFAQLAQPTLRPSRPARGLFGGGTGDTDQSLVLNLSGGGGFTQDLSEYPADAPPPVNRLRGGNATGSASLGYQASRGRVTAGVNFGVNGNYYRSLDKARIGSFGGGAQVGIQLSSSSQLSIGSHISRQPRNFYQLFGQGFDAQTQPMVPLDLSASTDTSARVSMNTAASFSQRITSRLSLYANAAHGSNGSLFGDPTTRNVTNSASVGTSIPIFRGLAFRLGYTYTASRYGKDGAWSHYSGPSLDGGLSYGKAISLTRRMSLSFATGVSSARVLLGDNRFVLTGSTGLSYEIGRSWTAAISVRRGLDFNLGFDMPVILDSASTGVGGQIGRRLQLGFNVGAARGDLSVVNAGAPRYATATGGVSGRVAITQMLGIGVGYSYFQSHFDGSSTLPAGLLLDMKRQSIRVTLDLWVPLFIRARRS